MKIDTCEEWLKLIRNQNPAMRNDTVKITTSNLEKLVRKTWNKAYEAGKATQEQKKPDAGLPDFLKIFKGTDNGISS